MKKIIKMAVITIVSIIVLLVVAVALYFNFAPQIGGKAADARLDKMRRSPNYREGKFVNPVETSADMPVSDLASTMWEMIKGDERREPVIPIQTTRFNRAKLDSSGTDDVAISWFGHSSLVIKIHSKVLLTDPVFGDRASMFSFMGPKRFDYTEPMSVEKLPAVDAVLISHDHYDHLDYETISKVKDKIKKFYVPLGVGAHLEAWGVPATSIVELGWWESAVFDENIELVCTPTRHFSGRALSDRFNTLWCSWVIKGKNQRVYFGGDSGYFPGFKEIGEKYGPFDITLLECGAYNEKWSQIHMMPEETAQAHLDLKGKVLMPIHWGKFNLALHPWKEPIERLTIKSKKENIQLATPVVGDLMTVPAYLPHQEWWAMYK